MAAGVMSKSSSEEPLESLSFNEQSERKIAAFLSRLPSRTAATLPVLWLAQEQFGWISENAMRLVAERLRVPFSHVYGVATFYTMYNKRPVGRFLIQVCTNISCMLCGGRQVLDAFRRELGQEIGETSTDGLFTLLEVECLAACGGAVAVQVNRDYHENVKPEDVPDLVAKLRAKFEATRDRNV